MELKYIAGRPMQMTADEWVMPGEEVDPGRFPYLDSFVSSGYLYVVHEGKGYDRLPPHVYTAVMERHEAEAKLIDNSPTLDPEREAAQEAVAGTLAVQVAERQAELRSALLDERPGTSLLERPDPVVDAARAEEAGTLNIPEQEQTPFQEPLPPVSHEDGPAATDPAEIDPSPAEAAESAPVTEERFDPADHVSREVLAYVEAHPDERERIIADERQGKNRSTLLRDLEG